MYAQLRNQKERWQADHHGAHTVGHTANVRLGCIVGNLGITAIVQV